jgi:hypothetical protein
MGCVACLGIGWMSGGGVWSNKGVPQGAAVRSGCQEGV